MENTPRLRPMTAIYLMRPGQILLLYRQGSRIADRLWVGSAGGHMEPDEIRNPMACVLRELHEELGLTPADLSDLQMRYVNIRRSKGEIRQNYYFFAELKNDIPLSSSEGILQWFDFDEIPTLDMPFSAKRMLMHYISTGIHTDRLYVGVADGKKVVFTGLTDF